LKTLRTAELVNVEPPALPRKEFELPFVIGVVAVGFDMVHEVEVEVLDVELVARSCLVGMVVEPVTMKMLVVVGGD